MLATLGLLTLSALGLAALFVAANLAALGLLRLKARAARRAAVAGQPLEQVYPDLDRETVLELQGETWARRLQYEPYTQLRERPCRGRYVNVDPKGFRWVENQGPWPVAPSNFNIFLFGGSTSFGYGVADADTIASRLQEMLSEQREYGLRVYNFARGFYYSTQECILLERLLVAGAVPHLALFVDGLNEFSQHDDAPYYANRIGDFVDRRLYRSSVAEVFNMLPLTRILKAARKGSSQIKRRTEAPWEEDGIGGYWPDDEVLVRAAAERYLENKRIVEAVTSSYGVQPVFVWEPVPSFKYDLRWHRFVGDGFGRHKSSRHGYMHMQALLESLDAGDHFLWCADMQAAMREPLYVDNVHFSAKMSRLIARRIADFLLEKERIPEVWPPRRP